MVKYIKILWMALVLVFWVTGCGLDFLSQDGTYDGTCYDCRTVCEGTCGSVLDSCLAACVRCQGYSKCFEVLDGNFQGMSNSIADWVQVDCTNIR